MAFNPFSWFRKHQKLFFAGLTILCMFVFIVQFGPGDLVEKATAWMGNQSMRGPTVATVHGRAVKEADLHDLLDQRQAANVFVVHTLNGAMFNAASKLALGDDESAVKEENTPVGRLRSLLSRIQPALGLVTNRKAPPQQVRQAEFQLLFALSRMPFQPGEPTLHERFQTEVASFVPRSKDKAEQAVERQKFFEVANRVGALLGFLTWRYVDVPSQQAGPFYFEGDGTAESLLDFKVWQKQADNLGITFSDADVMREINERAGGFEIFNAQKPEFATETVVAEFVKAYRPAISSVDLLKAVREELRVAMAKSLLLGYSTGGDRWRADYVGSPNASPVVATPLDFLRFYREQRTTVSVRLTPLPVEPFLADITTGPTGSEMTALFDNYKTREPQADSPLPGFKEPRRIRVGYVTASPTDSYFQTRAREIIYGTVSKEKVTGGFVHHSADWRRAYNVVQNAALNPIGAGPFGQALAILGPTIADPLQVSHGLYEQSASEAQPVLANLAPPPFGTRSAPESRLHLAGALRPPVVASLVAGFTPQNPFLTPVPLYAAGTVDSDVSLMHQGLAALLAPVVAQPRMESLFGMPAFVLTHRHIRGVGKLAPASRAVMEPIYLAAIEKRYATALMMANLSEFVAKVESFKSTSPPGQDVLEKEAARLHLTYRVMPQALTGAEITDRLNRKGDAGLGSLLTELRQGRSESPDSVVQELLRLTGLFEPHTVMQGAASPWNEKTLPEQEPEGKSRIVFWLVDSQKAKEPTSLDEARDKVVHAWKLDRARNKARERAREIVKKINEAKVNAADAARLIAEFRQKDNRLGESFVLDGVAPLTAPSREPLAMRRTEYQPYEVPLSAREQLPYAPQDMARQLLDLKEPGRAMLFADRPVQRFYIAVLEERSEPTIAEMKKVYEDGRISDNSLYGAFLQRQRAEYAVAMMKRLRKQAGLPLNADGSMDLSEDIQKRFPANPRSDRE